MLVCVCRSIVARHGLYWHVRRGKVSTVLSPVASVPEWSRERCSRKTPITIVRNPHTAVIICDAPYPPSAQSPSGSRRERQCSTGEHRTTCAVLAYFRYTGVVYQYLIPVCKSHTRTHARRITQHCTLSIPQSSVQITHAHTKARSNLLVIAVWCTHQQ